jgi:FkbM family methyltransferase
VLRGDGFFAFPAGVTRVWVDVGAHQLETTLPAMQKNPDLSIIAIEPRSEAWEKWPDSRRIIGVPVALGRKRGWLDFHVNYLPGGSSLLASDPAESILPLVDVAQETIEIRKVPVLRLEDVLERVPAHIRIEFLKLDVQGVDLQVLKSAGEQLRRVWHVKTEVIVHNEGGYIGVGEDAPGTEEEFTHYMESMGFSFVRDWNVSAKRMWLDKEYINSDLASRDPRVELRSADLEQSLAR